MTTTTPLTITRIEPATDDLEFAELHDPETGLSAVVTAVDVDVHAAGLTARWTCKQTWRNDHDTPIEGEYVFPLPPRAAVVACTVTLGGRRIDAQLQERGAARAQYAEAVAQGKRAALLEEDRTSTFMMTVGNIAPGETAVVEIELSGSVEVDGVRDRDGDVEAWEWTLRWPTLVAPRYTEGEPTGGGNTTLVPDAGRLETAIGGPPVPLTWSAQIVGVDGCELIAATHPGDVTEAGATLSLSGAGACDRDLVLRWRTAPSTVATTAVFERLRTDDGFDTTVEALLVPPVGKTLRTARDVLILLDRSGSMGGWKMTAARRCAARIVDALGSDDQVAVLAFDDRFEWVAGDRLWYTTDAARFDATVKLAEVEARGGTSLAAALAHGTPVFADAAPGRDRVLVVITDGQVSGEDAVVGQLARMGVTTIAVGIDSVANLGLLSKLAASSGGWSTVVESADRLDEALEGIVRRVGDPIVADLAVTIEGSDDVELAETTPAHLYPAGPVSVSLRMKMGRKRKPPVVVVTGTAASGKFMATTGAVPAAESGLAARWARLRVRALEDAWSAGSKDVTTDEIVAVSLRHSVLCRFTAFVAVDVDGEQVGDGNPPPTVRQRGAYPHGWNMVAAAMRGMVQSMAAGGDVLCAAAAPMTTSKSMTFAGTGGSTSVGGCSSGTFGVGWPTTSGLGQTPDVLTAAPSLLNELVRDVAAAVAAGTVTDDLVARVRSAARTAGGWDHGSAGVAELLSELGEALDQRSWLVVRTLLARLAAALPGTAVAHLAVRVAHSPHF